jgi:hypothetical protein
MANPAFVRVQSGSDVMLTNWAANPSFTGTTPYIGGVGNSNAQWTSISITTDRPHSGTRSYKYENCTVAGQVGFKAMTQDWTTLKVLKGTTISWSFWIYSTVAGAISPYWEGNKTADASYTGGTGGPSVGIPANTWSYVSGSNIVSVDAYIGGAGGYALSVGIGDSVWIDDFCITTSDVPYPYFDGDTPAADGYTYGWTGTANSSASVRKALGYVNRVNMATNPSFETTGDIVNIRTNNVTNPSFETTSGITTVRTNLLANPSMEAVGATTNQRVNRALNPGFETTVGVTNLRKNLVPNPNFEATSGTVDVRTNLHTNPSWTTASGTTQVRTNLCVNPTMELNINGYGAANQASVGRFASTAMSGSYVGRITFTGDTIIDSGVHFMQSFTAAPNKTYTISVDVLSNIDRSMKFSAQGTGTINQNSTNILLTGGAKKRVSWSFQTTATAPTGLSLYILRNDLLQGTLDFDRVLIEEGNTVHPYFDGASPIQNLVADGSFETTTLTTGPNWTGSLSTEQAFIGAKSLKLTRANTTQGNGWASWGWTATAGVTYTVSFYVYGGSGNYSYSFGNSGFQVFAAPGNQWLRKSFTWVATSSGWQQFIFRDDENPTPVAGTSIYMDAFLVEEGSQLNPFYIGNGDFTYAWSGTAHASTSTQQAPTAVGSPSDVYVSKTFQSSIWANTAGGKSLRIRPIGVQDSFTDLSFAWTIGKTYTISATFYQTAPQTGTLDGRARSIILVWNGGGFASSVADNVAGSQRISVTFKLTDTMTQFRLYNGASAGNGDVWWDDVLIEPDAGSASTYFDGSTPTAGDFTYAWAGTANASVSYQRAPGIIGANWNDRWFGSTGGSGVVYQGKGGISGNYARKLWKIANTGAIADTGINPASWIAVSPGTKYTLSAWVRTSVNQNMNFYIAFKDSSNADLPATSQNLNQPVLAGKWTRITVTGTAPASAATALPVITPYVSANPMPAGGTMDFDQVLFEASSTMLPYFDGSTPERINRLNGIPFGSLLPEGTVTSNYSWQGRTWQKLDTTANVTYRAWSSKTYFPDGVTIDASMEIGNPTNTTWSYSMDVNDSGVVTGTIGPYQSKRIVTSGSPFAGELAFLDISLPAGATLVVRNPFMEIRQGSTALPYFDGASNSDHTYAWSGTANASWSAQQGPAYGDIQDIWGDAPLYATTQYKIFGAKSARMRWNTNGTMVKKLPVTSTLPNKAVTVSMYVRPSVTMANVRLLSQTFTDTAGTVGIVENVGAYVNCPAGVVTRISQTFTTAATAASVRPVLNIEQDIAAGEYIDMDRLLIEESAALEEYFDGSAPLENLVSNSSFETNTTGWAADTGAPSLSTSLDYSVVGSRSLRAATTTSSADCSVFFTTTGLLPNTTYNMSWYVFSNEARNDIWFDAAAVDWQIVRQAATTIPAKTWTRVTGTFTTNNTISGTASFYLHHSGGPTTVGSAIYIDAPLLERASKANPYYNGLGDFSYGWTGTANSSMSVQQAPIPSGGYGPNNGSSAIWSSTTYSLFGTKSLGCRSLGGGINYSGIIHTVSVTANQPYTFSAWVYMPTSLYGQGLKAVFNGGGLNVTEGTLMNKVGEWGRTSVTVTPTVTGAAYIYLITSGSDAPAAGPVFYTDGWLFEQTSIARTYFDGATPIRNLCTNGAFETDTSGWNPNGAVTLTRDTSRFYGGTASLKIDTSVGVAYSGTAFYPTVSMGKWYTVSAQVWIPTGTTMNFACDNLSATPQMVAGTGNWQRVSMTGRATTAGFPVYFRSTAANQAAFWVDEVLVEESLSVNPFYEGQGDFSYAWTGTANASTSIQTGAGIASVTGANMAAISSTEWASSGTKSLRIIPTSSTTTDSFAAQGGEYGGLRLGLSPGKIYTVAATLRLKAPQTGTVLGDARSIVVFYQIGSTGYQRAGFVQGANTAGTQRLKVHFSMPGGATEAFIRLYNGATEGGGDVWWDDFVVEEDTTTGSYFDGSTAASGDYTYIWTGTANASTSHQQSVIPAGTGFVRYLSTANSTTSVGVTGVGNKAIRITPRHSSSGDSFAEIAGMVSGPFKANTIYTISGDRTILAPQTNLAGQTGYRANIGGEVAINYVKPAVNTAGTSRVVATFTTGATTAVGFIRVYNGAYSGGGDVWWDNIVIEEGVTDGSYFDGDSGVANGAVHKWMGTAHTSVSHQLAPRLENYGYETNIFSQPLTTGGVRVTNRAGSTHSFQLPVVGMASGQTLTILFRARHYKGGSIKIFGTMATPVVTLGTSYTWHRVTVTANSTMLFFSTQATPAGGGFDITHLMVVEGIYTGTYVDGTTWVAKWDGTAHGSTSVGYPPTTQIA